MNGFGIPMNASMRIQEEATKDLLHLLDVAGSISDWGTLQARVLFESVPMWRKEPYILLSTWEAKFHLSKVKATSRSVQAFRDSDECIEENSRRGDYADKPCSPL
jgi:hypothetical protein